ncbi:MAG: HAD family hydrolase, partial [Acidimicrobiia bacterium]
PRYVEGAAAVGIRAVLLDVRDPAAAFDEARRQLGLG